MILKHNHTIQFRYFCNFYGVRLEKYFCLVYSLSNMVMKISLCLYVDGIFLQKYSCIQFVKGQGPCSLEFFQDQKDFLSHLKVMLILSKNMYLRMLFI